MSRLSLFFRVALVLLICGIIACINAFIFYWIFVLAIRNA